MNYQKMLMAIASALIYIKRKSPKEIDYMLVLFGIMILHMVMRIIAGGNIKLDGVIRTTVLHLDFKFHSGGLAY
jgi:hypothetical protein